MGSSFCFCFFNRKEGGAKKSLALKKRVVFSQGHFPRGLTQKASNSFGGLAWWHELAPFRKFLTNQLRLFLGEVETASRLGIKVSCLRSQPE